MTTPDTLLTRTQCDAPDCLLCKYDDWTTDDKRHDQHTGGVTKQISHQYTAYGDYDNSCAVERANVRYLRTAYSSRAATVEIETGSYDYTRAWLPDTEANRELLQQLDSYPAFDDELTSQVEMEIEDEYLTRDGVGIFDNIPGDLKDLLEELDLLTLDREMYEAAKEETGQSFQVEAGGNGYIDFKRIAPAYQTAMLKANPALARLYELATQQTEQAAAWTLSFYDSAADMLDHLGTAPRPITQEEARALLIYAATMEATR